jgi:hypothetical protein
MSPEARERSFDVLATEMASGTLSRGKALRLMGAALVGGTLASLGIGEAAADNLCKPTGKKCRKNSQCCSENCANGTCAAACIADLGRCTADSQCCRGFCSNGICCLPDGSSCFENFHCCSGDCQPAGKPTPGVCVPSGE